MFQVYDLYRKQVKQLTLNLVISFTLNGNFCQEMFQFWNLVTLLGISCPNNKWIIVHTLPTGAIQLTMTLGQIDLYS